MPSIKSFRVQRHLSSYQWQTISLWWKGVSEEPQSQGVCRGKLWHLNPFYRNIYEVILHSYCTCVSVSEDTIHGKLAEYSNVEFSNSMPFSIFRLKSIVHNNNTSWIFRYWSSIDEVIREAVVLRGVKVRLLISFWKKTHPLTFNFVTSLKSLCVQLYNCSLEVVSESLTPVVLTTHGQVLIHTALMNYYFLLYMLFVKLLFFLAFF